MIAARPLIAAAALLALAGCLSPYQRFYQPMIPVDPTEPAQGEPRALRSSGDTVADIFALYEQGYGVIGISEFDSAPRPPSEALLQAKVVHAAIVVLSSKYAGTASGTLHFREPMVTEVDTSGIERSEGPRGERVRKYNEESWVSGSEATEMPYRFDYYDQAAVYFAPMKRQGFGALFAPGLTADQERLARTHDGVWVSAVWKDSPARAAGIEPGDVILSLDGRLLRDRADWGEAYKEAAGRTVDLVLSRMGTRLTRRAALPAGSW